MPHSARLINNEQQKAEKTPKSLSTAGNAPMMHGEMQFKGLELK